MAQMISVVRFSALDRWDSPATSTARVFAWPTTTLGAVADVQLGVQVPRKGVETAGIEVPYLRAANVQRGWFSLANVKTMKVTTQTVRRLELEPGDVLFVEGNSREEVGRSAIWSSAEGPIIIQNSIVRARLNTGSLDPQFVSVWLNSDAGGAYIRDRATTTSGSLWHIGAGKLADAPVPVPPLEVQQKVVTLYLSVRQRAKEAEVRSAALTDSAWKRFSSDLVDTTQPSVVADIVTVTRFAVLDRWDTDVAPIGITSPYPLVRLDLIADVRLGVQLQRSNSGGQDIPYLRVANVQCGYFDLTDVKVMNVSSEIVHRLGLKRDDLLFLEANSLEEVGRCARWEGQIPLCIHQNHVIRARLTTSELLPEYLEAWFNSPPGRGHVRGHARTTSGTLYTIPVSVLAMAPVPVPPLEEQVRLIEELRRNLEEARSVLNEAARLRKQGEADLVAALTQAK